MNNKWSVWLIAGIASLGGLLFGFNTGIISGAILFISNQFHLSTAMDSFLVSAVLFGALFGALFCGRLADWYGRRKLLVVAVIIFIVGVLCSFFAINIYWLIVGRIVVGISVGICSFVVPLYITEIAPTKSRGALVTLNQLFSTVGILLSYSVDYLVANEEDWHIMLLSGIIPAILLLAGMFYLPESTRWLIIHGWRNKARLSLRKIIPLGNVEAELAIIEQRLKQPGNWRDLLKPWVFPAMVIGFGLSLAQQITGINVVIYYGPTFLLSVGMHSALNAILVSIGIGIINVICTIVAIMLIDRIGRRALLLVGTAIMTVAAAILSCSFMVRTHIVWAEAVVITSMIIYVVGFAIGLGPVVWLMICEVFPIKIRGFAVSLATALNWAVNMTVVFLFLPLLHFFGSSYTFLIFTIFCFLSLLFVYFYIPETKNISLEQIEANLRTGCSSRELGD